MVPLPRTQRRRVHSITLNSNNHPRPHPCARPHPHPPPRAQMITLKVGQWVRVTGPFKKNSKNNIHLRKLGQVQKSVMHRGKLRAVVRLKNSVGDSRYMRCLPDRLEASRPPPHPTTCASYTYEGITVSDHVLTGVRPWVTSVHLPDHVVRIDRCVFYSRPSPCANVSSCTIPPSVSPIEWRRTSSNRTLTLTFTLILTLTLTLLKVNSIGWCAFKKCYSLMSITLPPSITTLPEACFEFCSSMHTLELPPTLKRIGEYAFNGCVRCAWLCIYVAYYIQYSIEYIGYVHFPSSINGDRCMHACG